MLEKFVRSLNAVSLPGVFNPYRDRCSSADLADAPKIRERNLRIFMETLDGTVGSIWFGRDLGYLGGRRTGIALTDEVHLESLQAVLGVSGMRIATSGSRMSERTASTVWDILDQLPEPPFLWNIFPFHPYSSESQLSNRCHTRKERAACAHLLDYLLQWAPSARLVAIGNDAARGLSEVGVEFSRVRHPSYGGKADFISGMEEIYRCNLGGRSSAVQARLI